MKIIHAADIHLGTPLNKGFPKDLADDINIAVRASFTKMLEYAEENGIKAILLAGDVFDSDVPGKKDTDFFYGAVNAHPDITFYYLRGNHDAYGEPRKLDNLKIFGTEWTYYDLGENVVLAGIEMDKTNAVRLYGELELDAGKTNIVMLHGNVSSRIAAYEIHLKSLEGKNIDYLALGHIHKREEGRLDNRGFYAYPGILEPRDFGEGGEHGFSVLDISHGVIRSEFQKNASREFKEIEIEIPREMANAYMAPGIVIDALRGFRNPKNLYRVILVGEKEEDAPDIAGDIETRIKGSGICSYIEVIDNRVPYIDVEALKEGDTLFAEFVREIEQSSLDENEKKEAISLGLRALRGELK